MINIPTMQIVREKPPIECIDPMPQWSNTIPTVSLSFVVNLKTTNWREYKKDDERSPR